MPEGDRPCGDAPGLVLVRVPDHLGDGVLARPAVEALARLAPLQIVGPRWVDVVYAGIPVQTSGRPDVAVLFKPAIRAALQALRIPRRIGLPTDHRRLLLTDVVAPGGGHRMDDYARIVAVLGVTPTGPPAIPAQAGGPIPLPPKTALMLPASKTGATVEWPGHRRLADLLVAKGYTPVFTGGPGEDARVAAAAGPHAILPPLTLVDFCRAAVQADLVIGNDSGLTHLAAAARRGAGVPVTAVHGVTGSTDPVRTGAPGATWHPHPAPPPCWPCYAKSCDIDLACLTVSPGAVDARIPAAG